MLFLDCGPQSNHNINSSTIPDIYTLPDIQITKDFFVIGKLTALIEIDNGWNSALFNRFLYGMDDMFCFHTVGNISQISYIYCPCSNIIYLILTRRNIGSNLYYFIRNRIYPKRKPYIIISIYIYNTAIIFPSLKRGSIQSKYRI